MFLPENRAVKPDPFFEIPPALFICYLIVSIITPNILFFKRSRNKSQGKVYFSPFSSVTFRKKGEKIKKNSPPNRLIGGL
jgi:hypothetical protein